MKLADLQEVLKPVAKMALEKQLTYTQFERACLLILVQEALEQSGGVQKIAAKRIGMTQPTLSNLLHGKVEKPRTKPPAGPRGSFADRHQGTPAAVIGAMEV
ncbi:MAG TPA: helix-turn-helix domain-containing protein [Candidatus Angelobacter sp.]|nr:helix-turn-helix domain-containing protein [Candidatus Angelobacter sp.]